jgi:hypothetical protein
MQEMQESVAYGIDQVRGRRSSPHRCPYPAHAMPTPVVLALGEPARTCAGEMDMVPLWMGRLCDDHNQPTENSDDSR